MLDNDDILPQEISTQLQLYKEQISLYKENVFLLKDKIQRLEKELFTRDSPQAVADLQEQMHYYRRECDKIAAKLREAEAYIAQQKTIIEGQTESIDELRRRCKELEEKELRG